MQLIVFSAPSILPHEADLVTSVLARGLRTLHLRKPGQPAATYEDILAPLSAAARARVVLHDHHHLAARWGVKVSCMPCLPEASAYKMQYWPQYRRVKLLYTDTHPWNCRLPQAVLEKLYFHYRYQDVWEGRQKICHSNSPATKLNYEAHLRD